jgi:hypothetical protein
MLQVQAAEFLQAGDVHFAVLMYLASGFIKKAVEAYRSCGLWQEAILLARLRLGDDTDDAMAIADVIYLDWAADLEKRRNFEAAAKCFVAARLPEKAVYALSRKHTLEAYEAAYHISCLNSAGGGQVELATLCGCEALGMRAWDIAGSYFSKHDELADYAPMLATEQILVAGAEAGSASSILDNICAACAGELAGDPLISRPDAMQLRHLSQKVAGIDVTRNRSVRQAFGAGAVLLTQYAMDLTAQRLEGGALAPDWGLLLGAVEAARRMEPEDAALVMRAVHGEVHVNLRSFAPVPRSPPWLAHKCLSAFCRAWAAGEMLAAADFAALAQSCQALFQVCPREFSATTLVD